MIGSTLLALAVLGSPSAAPTFDDDCFLAYKAVKRTSNGIDTVIHEESGEETCPDGSTIVVDRQVTESFEEFTVVTDEDWVSAGGECWCPDATYAEVIHVHVGTEIIENGDVCPSPEGCILTSFESYIETIPQSETTRATASHEPITCPDGSPGVRTTNIATTYVQQRWVSIWSYSNCPTAITEGAPFNTVIGVTTDVWDNCPIPPSAPLVELAASALPVVGLSVGPDARFASRAELDAMLAF